MTFVVCVFQPADDGRGRSDPIRQLALGEAGRGAKVVDLARNASI